MRVVNAQTHPSVRFVKSVVARDKRGWFGYHQSVIFASRIGESFTTGHCITLRLIQSQSTSLSIVGHTLSNWTNVSVKLTQLKREELSLAYYLGEREALFLIFVRRRSYKRLRVSRVARVMPDGTDARTGDYGGARRWTGNRNARTRM